MRNRPTKYQTGGDPPFPAAFPKTRDHIGAATRGLYPGEKDLLRNLNFTPSMPIITELPQQEGMAGRINRNTNQIMLNAEETGGSNYGSMPVHKGRYTGDILSHEIGHTLHRGPNQSMYESDELKRIINEEADRLDIDDKRRQDMLSMADFHDALEARRSGKTPTPYEERPQERFAHMAQETMMSDNPDPFNEAVINRIIEEREMGLGGFIKNNLSEIGTGVGLGVGAFLGDPATGAKVGGLAGDIGEKALEEPEENPLQRTRPTRYAQATRAMAYGGSTKYAFGGKSMNIGQDAKEFVGPRHENGGVPLNDNIEVEGGETMDNINGSDYIFSDRLTVPEHIRGDQAPITFAEYHKQIVQDNASPAEIQELADAQEEVSGREVGPNTNNKNPIRYKNRKYGGKKMMGGGYKRKRPTEYQTGGNRVPSIQDIDNRVDVPTELEYGESDLRKDILATNMSQESGTQGFGNFARQALPYLPAAMNLSRGLFESSDISNVPYSPPSGRGEETIQQMNTDVDVDPQLASVDRSLRNILADPNASMNEKLAASSQASTQRANIQNQAEMQENQLENQMLSRLAGAQQRRDQAISNMRTQSQRATRRQQMQSDEARRQLIQQGLQQAGTTFQKQKAYEDMLENDAMRFTAMMESMPNTPAKTRIIERLMKKYPERRQQLQELLP